MFVSCFVLFGTFLHSVFYRWGSTGPLHLAAEESSPLLLHSDGRCCKALLQNKDVRGEERRCRALNSDDVI